MVNHSRDKRSTLAVTAPPTFDAADAAEYLTTFLKPNTPAEASRERAPIAPFLARLLREGDDTTVAEETIVPLFEQSRLWLADLGQTVDTDDAGLAESLTLIAAHSLLNIVGRIRKPLVPLDEVAEFAEDLATRIVEAQEGHSSLISTTAACLFAVSQGFQLPAEHPKFGASIFRILGACRRREFILPVLPYVLPSQKKACPPELLKSVGTFVAQAAGANDEATAIAAVSILPVFVEVYGAEACGLDAVVNCIEEYPLPHQTNVGRNAVRRAVLEVTVRDKTELSVECYQRSAADGYAYFVLETIDALRRYALLLRLYSKARGDAVQGAPYLLLQRLFGVPPVDSVGYVRGDEIRCAEAATVRARDLGRAGARDAKAAARECDE